MPMWVFWLLLVAVIGLGATLWVRDKELRGKIVKLFLRIKNKIRVARINARINKEHDKLKEIYEKVGEVVCTRRLEVSVAFEERTQADKLLQESKATKDEIERLDREIDKNLADLAAFSGQKDKVVKELENTKEPLEKELHSITKQVSEQEKERESKEKALVKMDKKIAAHKTRIEEIKNDPDLSNIEKENQYAELEAEIKGEENEKVAIIKERDAIREGKPGLDAKAADLKTRVEDLEKQIKTHKEEKKAQEKKTEAIAAGHRSNRTGLVTRQNQLTKELSTLFTQVGEQVNKQRVDDAELAGLYSQIDALNREIKELKAQVGRQKKRLKGGGENENTPS